MKKEDLKKGVKVSWKSQAAGITKEKTGTLVCLVPKNKDAAELGRAEGETITRLQGNRTSLVERALVKVPTPGGKSHHFYTPTIAMLLKRGRLPEVPAEEIFEQSMKEKGY